MVTLNSPRTLRPLYQESRQASDEMPRCAAETAPCNCPDFCERDHGNE